MYLQIVHRTCLQHHLIITLSSVIVKIKTMPYDYYYNQQLTSIVLWLNVVCWTTNLQLDLQLNTTCIIWNISDSKHKNIYDLIMKFFVLFTLLCMYFVIQYYITQATLQTLHNKKLKIGDGLCSSSLFSILLIFKLSLSIFSFQISDDERMSLTTAVSDDEPGDGANSPKGSRKPAASFNCTGAVRKAG